MARTQRKYSDRMAANRTYQRARRERLAASKSPDTAQIDRAVLEALSFAIASGQRTADGKDILLPVSKIFRTAQEILVDRLLFEETAAKQGIARRLASREEHLEPSYVPSLRPNREAQLRRIDLGKMAAEMAER